MLRGPAAGPRSPLRVAVLTFGAIVLVGTMISLVMLGKQGLLDSAPGSRGERAGRGVGVLGVVGAAIAFVVQRRRMPPEPREPGPR